MLLAQVTDDSLVGADRWSGGGSFGLIVVTLVLFVGLGLVAWFLNRRGAPLRRAAGQHLEVLETRPLGGRQFLMVAAYGDERFLLSVCPGRVEYLCSLPVIDEAPAPPESDPPRGGAFGQVFEKVAARSRSKGKP